VIFGMGSSYEPLRATLPRDPGWRESLSIAYPVVRWVITRSDPESIMVRSPETSFVTSIREAVDSRSVRLLKCSPSQAAAR
jgi:hypothetical protein